MQAALEVDPHHVPALFAAAQLLLASAKYRIVQGTPGASIFPSVFISLAHLLPVWSLAVVVCLLCRCPSRMGSSPKTPVTCRSLGSQLFQDVCSGQMSVLTQQLRDLLVMLHFQCCISLAPAVCTSQLLLVICKRQTVKLGLHTGNYSRLYVPEPGKGHVFCWLSDD